MNLHSPLRESAPPLFDRVATILDVARSSVVRAVNSRIVLAYWLIGREIVQDLQGGDERAEYGKRIIADLAEKLAKRYGTGYSPVNLAYFFPPLSPRLCRPRGPDFSPTG